MLQQEIGATWRDAARNPRRAMIGRTGLAWSHRYRHTIEALRTLLVKSAYLDGKVKINFDAGTVDQMIERLLVLQTQMLPKPAPARKRN